MDAIAFFHMNQLGDLLFSLPVLRSARTAWKDKQLYSVLRPELAPLLEASGLVDGVIHRPKSGAGGFFRLCSDLSRRKIARSISFSESPETLLMQAACGIRERYGFATASFSFLLTHTAPRSGVPSLANNRRLAETAGLSDIPVDYTGLVRVPEAEQEKARAWILQESDTAERIVLLSPGASRRRQEKHWPEEKWAGLINLLNKHYLSPVLIGAPHEQIELTRIALRASKPARVFSSTGGILSLAGLMMHARAFAGIDSGAMHLAASLNVPVAGLFGPTDPLQIGPQPLEKHRIVRRPAMAQITVEDVWTELSGILFSK